MTPFPSRPRTAFATGGALLFLSLAGCGGSPAPAPPDVRWGEDVCSRCTMIVSEERHAAAAAVAAARGHEFRVYDDISCLLAEPDVAGFVARWVHDLEEVRWIGADTARYVPSRELRTPMGSGIAAFASAERAASFAGREGAEVLDWSALRERRAGGSR